LKSIGEHTLNRSDSQTDQPSCWYAGNLVLISLLKRQQILELEAVPWPLDAFVHCIVNAEHTGMADWRPDDEDT
jgi:hypothetical protein